MILIREIRPDNNKTIQANIAISGQTKLVLVLTIYVSVIKKPIWATAHRGMWWVGMLDGIDRLKPHGY